MNIWNGIGRLTKDPDVRYNPQTQNAVAKFTLAIDDGYGEKKRTNFISVVAFNKTAENCEKFLAKGNRCGVTGKIQTGSYNDKEGKTVYTTDVIADRVEFIDFKSKEEQEEIPHGFSALSEEIPF